MSTKKHLTSRDRQAIATKEKIYRTGIALLQQHGFDGVNISQIAKSAGVSVGTFYHYYTSKLDLFMDLYKTADAYYEEEITERIKALPYTEKILLFFREYGLLAEKNGVELTRKMYIPDNTLFLGRTEGMHRVLLEILQNGQEDGAFDKKKTPCERAGDLFLIARGVIFDWALRGGEYDLTEKMDAMLRLYLDGQRPAEDA